MLFFSCYLMIVIRCNLWWVRVCGKVESNYLGRQPNLPCVSNIWTRVWSLRQWAIWTAHLLFPFPCSCSLCDEVSWSWRFTRHHRTRIGCSQPRRVYILSTPYICTDGCEPWENFVIPIVLLGLGKGCGVGCKPSLRLWRFNEIRGRVWKEVK